jgi:CDP-glucose 4,6-dehydratase
VGFRSRAVESMALDSSFWRGRKVFVTGHTGFKGGWLCLWLRSLGAEVHGYALTPPTDPNIFTVARVGEDLASSNIADIRDYRKLSAAIKDVQPELIFHLAAQPLVRHSYENPVETYEVNVMGVVHLLEAVRTVKSVRAVVNVTTDKCYENRERLQGYRESEAMGGHDPYSSSKGCAELVTATYRSSFLAGAGIAAATARAGNIIGGGDWADDRLVPDFLRALDSCSTLTIRSPESVRPWQHVLEPISGYLVLAERLHAQGAEYAEAWNFGPRDEDARTVGWIVERLASQCPSVTWERDASPKPHEAHYLKLDSSKAGARLNWKPRWHLGTALDKTLEWHHAWRKGGNMQAVTLSQIDEFLGSGSEARVAAF